MDKVFSSKLSSARKIAGLSFRDLDDRLRNKVTCQALNNYEKGKRIPNNSILIALANVLGAPIDYFLKYQI